MLYFLEKNISKDTTLKLVDRVVSPTKQLVVLPSDRCLSPDDINDTYIDIITNLQLDINIYNSLLYKARL